MVACGNEGQFKDFCKVLNKEEWIEDERFSTNSKRVENKDMLTNKIQKIMYRKEAEEWFKLLSENNVPSGPVNNVKEVFEHPQVRAREMVKEVSHPNLGKVKLVRNPILFSKNKNKISQHPPTLGEHTDSLLNSELGLSKEQIKQLKTDEII